MGEQTWIAVDWGTTHLRVWQMAGHEVLAEAQSDRGMGTLSPEEFEPALLELIQPWLEGREKKQVYACGMVGARQGWIEAPYVTVPANPGDATGAVTAPVASDGIQVRILPGLCQTDPADVMRGEETQISGLLLGNPDFDGLVCLPGTHTKWVRVENGRVLGFQTFMTGELFALLSGQSVLRHSMHDDGWNADAFAAGFNETLADPNHLMRALFSLRAEGLLRDTVAGEAKARLSGLLMGAEFAAMGATTYSVDVTVIGDGAIIDAYRDAFRLVGANPRVIEARTATLLGLRAARDAFERNTV